MAKKSRKKRRLDTATFESVDDQFNISGFETFQNDSVEDCLTEMESASRSLIAATRTETANNRGGGQEKDTLSTSLATSDTEGHPSASQSLWDPDVTTKPPIQRFDTKARVETWNKAYLEWTSKGNYTTGLLPNVDIEISRHFKAKELSSFLIKSGSDIRMPTFERWLLDSKFEEQAESPPSQTSVKDPVLPHSVTQDTPASKRLEEELLHNDLSRDEATKVVKELCRQTQVAVQELQALSIRCNQHAPLKKGDRIDLEDHNTMFSILYCRKRWKKPFCVKLNKSHYNKLRDMFLNVHNQTNNSSKLVLSANSRALHGFHLLVLSLLVRYSALSGGQLLQDFRGGGMQGAVHEHVFRLLRTIFDGQPMLECFASPFNAYLPYFGSAFTDLDWHFGAVGNFFDMSFTSGCCEANPPFSPGLMSGMVLHMEKQLSRAGKKGAALTFVIIVPTADEALSADSVVKKYASKSFSRMLSSNSCRLHLKLDAREHGYVEGAQHARPTRYKQSPYDTSVLILQSQKAHQEPLDKEKLEKKLRAAFSTRHTEELQRQATP